MFEFLDEELSIYMYLFEISLISYLVVIRKKKQKKNPKTPEIDQRVFG